MAFASATPTQREVLRDTIVNASKLIERAVETGAVLSYSSEIDKLGPQTVVALHAAGAGSSGTTAVVGNGAAVVMKNSAGTTVGSNGTITVVGGVLTEAKAPATTALVVNAGAYTVPVTGSYATKATFTVANGVITAIVLS